MKKHAIKWTSIRIPLELAVLMDSINKQRSELNQPKLSRWQLVQHLSAAEIERNAERIAGNKSTT